jgi:hypothetical protein
MDDRLAQIRRDVVGADASFDGPFGRKTMLYADWTASGRALVSVEDYVRDEVLPLIRQHTHHHEHVRVAVHVLPPGGAPADRAGVQRARRVLGQARGRGGVRGKRLDRGHQQA